MYNIDILDKNNKQSLLYILNNMGLFPYIDGNDIVIDKDKRIVLKKNKDYLFINDLVDLGINVVDSKYIYYLIDIAFDNSVKVKKKSLRL